MKPPQENNKLATFYLERIVHDLLRGFDYVIVSQHTAEVLLLVSENKIVCHVQLPGVDELDLYSSVILEPRLWSLESWRISVEKNQRTRKRSLDERHADMVYQANVRMISKCILRMFAIEPNAAHCSARLMLERKQFEKISAITKGRKLYTNIKEIP